MRKAIALCWLLAAVVTAGPTAGAECPANPNALGTSRTIVVDPAEHNRLGSFQYRESLPLEDKEVVITFDDGPLPPYTSRILDILAGECVKATFFMVGKQARAFPRLVRRVHDEGHTLANHSESHPYNFHLMSVLDAAREIEDSQESIAAAVGDPAKVSPFFRFPGLHRQEAVEQYLASKGQMTWSVDFMGDDWTRISAREIVRRVIGRLEAKGKGILMLHDIRPATALGLHDLLNELKTRGYRVVHVVPATAAQPKTATTPEQWQVAKPPSPEELAHRGPSMWPRVISYKVKVQDDVLQAPGLTSFGADSPDAAVPVSLVRRGETLQNTDRAIALPFLWPDRIVLSALTGPELLPVPAAYNFRYTSMTRRHSRRAKQRPARPATAATVHEMLDITGSINGHRSEPKARRHGNSRSDIRRPPLNHTGHQIQITPPTASLQTR